MRVSLFMLVVAVVILGFIWWVSMGPARNMISEIRPGMDPQQVMESGSGWVSCTLQSKPDKNDSLRFMAIVSPASGSVSTTSSTFPEDKPSRTWINRRQFSTELERRIRASKTPWDVKFVFTGVLSRSDFTVTFAPDGKVSKVSMLHMQPAKPSGDPLAR